MISSLATRPRGPLPLARSVVAARTPLPPRRRLAPARAQALNAAVVSQWVARQPALAQGVAGVALCLVTPRIVADQLQRMGPGVRNLRALDIASGVGAAMGAIALAHRALVSRGVPPWAPSAVVWGATCAVGLWRQDVHPLAYAVGTAFLTAFNTGASCLVMAGLNLLVRRGVPLPVAVALWAALPAGWVGAEAGRQVTT